MTGTLEMLHKERSHILELAQRHGVTSVRVFGSVARGQDKAACDIGPLKQWGRKRQFEVWSLKLTHELQIF